MKFFLVIMVCIVGCILIPFAQGQQHWEKVITPKPLNPDDPKGSLLPPGVPRTVDKYGNVIGLDSSFTTEQYRKEAIRIMTLEANNVARKMALIEVVPITESNLTQSFVAPFAFEYVHKAIGNISTTNYAYYFSIDNKFNEVGVANYDQVCLNLERQKWPIAALNTNEAYEYATQWLGAASIDVDGLNRNCTAHVALSPYWNDFIRLGDVPKRNFVPIYFVWWTSEENGTDGYGDVAYVELFSPTKKLLHLGVRDSQYVLRNPLVFTNLPSLFPGVAPTAVITNWPVFKYPAHRLIQ